MCITFDFFRRQRWQAFCVKKVRRARLGRCSESSSWSSLRPAPLEDAVVVETVVSSYVGDSPSLSCIFWARIAIAVRVFGEM